MFALTAREVMAITGALLVAGKRTRVVRDVVVDHREVVPGGTFVAFVGEVVDGNAFAPQAIALGCGCVVLSGEPSAELIQQANDFHVCLLRAKNDNPQQFLLALAKEWRRRHHWLCVGITGSVGKTTTKELTVAALKKTFTVHANEGNLNSVIGLPLTILRTPEDTQVLVLEMGTNHRGEIAAIAKVALPQLGAITNIGTSHIGNLGSRQAIADEKAQLIGAIAQAPSVPGFEGVKKSVVMASSDDFTPYIQKTYAKPQGVQTLKAGWGNDDDFQARAVKVDAQGHPSCVVRVGKATYPLALNLVGKQALIDSLFALAIAYELGVRLEDALEGMGCAKPSAMRAELKETPGGWRVIDDSYNASPASLACALDTLAGLEAKGRKICVIGQVGELGESSRWLHGLIGSYVAARRPAMVCFVGSDDAQTMAEAARIMGLSQDRICVAQTTEQALELVQQHIAPGDVVLVKGSRAVGLDRLVNALGA